MSFEYPHAKDGGGQLVFSEHLRLNKKRHRTLTREQEEDALSSVQLREYHLYRDGCFRRHAVPLPPSIWRQSMPAIEADVEDAEKEYHEGREADGPHDAKRMTLEKWLDKKWPTLRAEYKRQMQDPAARAEALHQQRRTGRVYATFAQWLEYRYAERCAQQRLFAKGPV